MTALFGKVRIKVSFEKMDENDARSLLLGEILLNISHIETEMTLVIGYALGMKPEDAMNSIRDLNFTAKIKVLESIVPRISLSFASDTVRKRHFKKLRELKDIRNTIAHGVIFADAQGPYMGIPTGASLKRNSSSVPLDLTGLENIRIETTSVSFGYRLARAAAETRAMAAVTLDHA